MSKEKEIKKEFLFGKRNFRLLLIALSFIAFGFILMVGGGSKDPNVFNPEIFSFQRIRLAPTFVLILIHEMMKYLAVSISFFC